MINLSAVKSLNDIPESFRHLFSLDDGGTLSLDEGKLKTQQDIDNILEAKKKEVSDHNATKAELAKYRKLAGSAEELEARLSELEASSGSASEQSEKLKKALLDFKAKEKEAATIKAKLDAMLPEYEQLKAAQTRARIASLVDEELKAHKEVDSERTRRVLLKDIATGYIGLDETGTVLQLKDGGKLGDYIDQTAKDFGFTVKSTAGATLGSHGVNFRASNDGHKQFSVQEESFLDDASLAQANL